MPSELAPADSMGLAVGDTSKGQTLAADAAQTPLDNVHEPQTVGQREFSQDKVIRRRAILQDRGDS